MMNVSFNCKTCNSSFYVNNIINIGRPSNKEVACPICQSKILVLTSGIPTSSKIQTRRCLISDFLTKNYSHLPLFKNCIYHIIIYRI
jgi:DNA-directed RNA polymerase subunit RPC12/RpoP